MAREIFGEVISTGSEMMLGRLVDTNSAWLSEALNSAGIKVVRHTSVGDDLPRIIKAFQRAWEDHNVIVATGGLGPTEDDLTRQAVAEAFGLELEYHEELAEELRAQFATRGYTLTENNLRQAWLPKGSLLVPNSWGTAPGFALCDDDHLMVFLPGVPVEMKNMTRDWFLPQLKKQFPSENGLIKTIILKTAGLGESMVDSMVGDLMRADRNPTVGLLAAPDMVRVVVAAKGSSEAEIESLLAPTLAELEKRLTGHIFGYGDTTLPQATAGLIRKMGLSLTILDAATQGRLSGALSPAMDPNNWGGAQELPWQPTVSGVMEILRLYAPDSVHMMEEQGHPSRRQSREIRLITTSRPDTEAPAHNDDETALIIENAVQSETLNHGRPIVSHFRLGGARGRALSRAAVLANFHLWQVLRQYSNDF
ncbi:hypothetical protein C4J81_01015 [Deltaproteobacteria bacterium Smac51]|nr:hypothetical protein C4J81_01015 [Deltaproteobacteria bacterium Smac51]